MSKQDLKSLIGTIKDSYDIEDYLRDDGVTQIVKSGPHKYKALCPFHMEKTPSFIIDTQFQNYHCFGCQEHGDIISYVQKVDNYSFRDALKVLADAQGITIQLSEHEDTTDYLSLRQVLRESANYYYKQFAQLDNSHPAKQEIVTRNLPLTSVLFGYAPENMTSLYRHLVSAGFTDEIIEQSGVCRTSQKGNMVDFWSGRLMFFITDIQGHPIGFSGKKLYESDTRGKYVNSSNTPLFDKSHALYNISYAKKPAGDSRELYIVEGQFDVAAMKTADCPNVVAASGTALTQHHAQTCSRVVGGESGKLIFCLDGDAGGEQSVYKVFRNHPTIHAMSYVVTFPDTVDPCDYREQYGDDKLKSFVEHNRQPLVDCILDSLEKKHDLTTSNGRAAYYSEAVGTASCIRNATLRDNATRRISLNALTSYESVRGSIQAQHDQQPPQHTSFVSSDHQDERDNQDVESHQEQQTIQLIDQDMYYHVASKLIAIGVRHQKLRESLAQRTSWFPRELQTVIHDVIASPSYNKVIIENFSTEHVARKIFDREFTPFLATMSASELWQQCRHLYTTLQHEYYRQYSDNRQYEIAQTLRNGSVDDLKKAIEVEQRESISSLNEE